MYTKASKLSINGILLNNNTNCLLAAYRQPKHYMHEAQSACAISAAGPDLKGSNRGGPGAATVPEEVTGAFASLKSQNLSLYYQL
jgi:hypothetical protein